jgi:hypothetical protein
MKNLGSNPHCPIRGCRTSQPHADDPIAKGLIHEFAPPEKLTFWVLHGMAELRDSICRDVTDQKIFAWHTRLRQPEELYIRTLYALFVADEKELHHVLSGAMPNGLSGLYSRVNALVFEGRGLLQAPQPGLNHGTFTPMDTLNDGAHLSFPAFMTCIGMARNPQYLPSDLPAKYHKHLTTYCKYLEYMHGMFKAGKDKKHVLSGVINLHRPASYWNEQQRQLKEKKWIRAPA